MFSFSHAGSARFIVALALAGFCGAASHAQDASQKFKEATDLYFRGKVDEALKAFQEILATNPSNEEAFKLYRECGREVMALMLVKGGEFETTAKRFLELSTLGRKEKSDDKAAIAALVEKVMSGNYLDQRDAVYKLSSDHGEYGAAPLVKFLAQEDGDKRVVAMDALQHMSGDAVLPLIAALGSGDAGVTRNACACLGAIKDVRALPWLKKVFESTNDTVVKSAADDAVRKIIGHGAADIAPSNELHVNAATSYFTNNERVVKPFDTPDAVWSWSNGEVVETKVPAILRSLKLAEQECRAAPESPVAESILLASLAGEKAACLYAKESGVEGAPEPDAAIDVMLAAGGIEGLSAALDFAVKNDRPLAAVEVIKTLDSMGAGAPALQAQLGSGYKSVRYQAAFALAGHGDSSAPVVNVLGEAIGEAALRTVLVVDDRSESRNAIAAALRGAGYTVITAENGGVGFARARTLPPKDVVLVRAGMADITVDQFVYDSDFRNSSSGIVLLSDAQAADALKSQYEGKGKVKALLTDPVTAQAVVDAVKAAMPEANTERTAALAAAEKAAALLGQMNAAALAPAKDALVKSLARTEEPVVVGALKAVGRLGAADAAPAVSALFADSSKSEAIRVAAADALGGIFANMKAAPGEDVLKPVLDAAASDAAAPVRLAAGRALGSAAFLNAAQRAELLKGAAK
jgi:HEAT repeat protein